MFIYLPPVHKLFFNISLLDFYDKSNIYSGKKKKFKIVEIVANYFHIYGLNRFLQIAHWSR